MAVQRGRRPPASATVFAPAAGVAAGTGLAVVVFLGMQSTAFLDGDADEAAARRNPPGQVSVSLRSAQPYASSATGAQPFDPARHVSPPGHVGSALPLLRVFAAGGVVDGVVAEGWAAPAPVGSGPVVLPPSTSGGVPQAPGGSTPSPGGLPTDPPTDPNLPGAETPTDPPTDPGLPDPGGGGDPSGGDGSLPDTGTVDPGTVEPGTVDSGTGDSGTVVPGTTDPSGGDPVPTDVGTTDAGTIDTGTTDPLSDPTTATSDLGTDPTQWDVPAA